MQLHDIRLQFQFYLSTINSNLQGSEQDEQ